LPRISRRNAGAIRTRLPALLAAVLLWMQPGGAVAEWLPSGTVLPRNPADPREPRLGMTYAPAPDYFDAALGAPLPMISFPVSDWTLVTVLEAGVFFRLGRDGSFFPMQTVDGLFGAGLETRRGAVTGRLQLLHESAHKADGDSTVAFRDRTFSREFWRLEIGWARSRTSLYFRTGSSWHAIPSDKGLDVAIGAVWRGRGRSGRPFFSAHANADAAREWRVSKTVLAGWESGTDRRVRLALRFFDGLSPRGQYWNEAERYLGFDVQFTP
jgi:hypothetical protein